MTQKQALDILKIGHNVFLTGAAGSGKTYVLNQYIAYLRKHTIAVGITASTGIAATHMGGVTIHSWVGMGIKDEITGADLGELFKKPYLRNRFLHTKVLIIDEISMLHSHRLDMVDQICKAFKKNSLPFGGMQVVMCGDFFQLPPVNRNSKSEYPNSKQIQNLNDRNNNSFENLSFKHLNIVSNFGFRVSNLGGEFVTESQIWGEMHLQVCYLDEQFRQDDRSFLRVLNDIRNNEVSEFTFEALSERINKDVKGYAKPTRLYTHNAAVDAINEEQLQRLSEEAHEYFMSSRGALGLIEILQNSCLAPRKLVLKKGAQVMFVKNNYEEGYVNGTIGEVIGFDKEDHPIVRTFDGKEITVIQMSWEVKEEDIERAAITQFPLRLAWAITVHKSQGMSLDAAEVDLSKSFIPGMGYVALSRVRSLAGLKLLGINQMALAINETVLEIDKEFRKKSDAAELYLIDIGDDKKRKMQEDFLEFLKRT